MDIESLTVAGAVTAIRERQVTATTLAEDFYRRIAAEDGEIRAFLTLSKERAMAAAAKVDGLADKGDPLCREVFRVQAHALGLFFDEMINTFDPDALIVGGGAIEASAAFQKWFIQEIRNGMPPQREEQADIPIHIMPNGDTAGARGAAIEALTLARQSGLA